LANHWQSGRNQLAFAGKIAANTRQTIQAATAEKVPFAGTMLVL
jgi:hypothetical protein